ncbi:hypothetical protein [Virgibacillus salexigens]|uniref:Uncharacterized protein n=1 Tax=Virgibacillus massiliensis TaxID=1462526 RepID=A0A024QH25_9BACI|nr:hypothetical protein [Virgibacillus massiliensis]CDQ41868.1 hypothetical protein BN990_04247 [Virgibacillus massiliensis]
MSIVFNSKQELTNHLEKFTLEEQKTELEFMISKIEEEVEIALIQNNNELAIWKMSIELLIEDVLKEVENKLIINYSLNV